MLKLSINHMAQCIAHGINQSTTMLSCDYSTKPSCSSILGSGGSFGMEPTFGNLSTLFGIPGCLRPTAGVPISGNRLS